MGQPGGERVGFRLSADPAEGRHRAARLQETFDRIAGHKGYLEEGDIRAFARRERLPEAYVAPFFHGIEDRRRHTATYERFAAYVASREPALRRAFAALDTDHNGRLSRPELEAGLATVAFSCGASGDFYRCQARGVRRLLGTLPRAAGRGGGVTFEAFRDFFLLLPREEFLVDYWIRARCPGKLDLGGAAPLALAGDDKHQLLGRKRVRGHLTAGAAAGAVSRTVTAPLEVLRLQAMTAEAPPPSFGALAKGILETRGWRGFWRGNLLNVLKSAPAKALDFFAFDFYKGLLRANAPGRGPLRVFAAAGLAGASTAMVVYPLEVVRMRLVADVRGQYRGPLHAGRAVVAAEGAGALYRGLRPSLLAIVPEAAITYGLYDSLKRAHVALRGREAGVAASIGFGLLASCVGQAVSFPLETVSRRLQVASGAGKRFLPELQHLVRQGGVGALYRGWGATALKLGPSAIASFGTYELVRAWLTALEARQARERAAAVAAAAALGARLPPQQRFVGEGEL